MQNIDWKKVRSVVTTYAVLALPVATAAFAMNASTTVKVLSFLSGFVAIIVRQSNPKDPFTINILKMAQAEIEAQLEKAEAKPRKKAAPKA